MTRETFTVEEITIPRILSAGKDFLLVYKPPRMHSAPQAGSAGETILEWCARQFPGTADLPGRKPGEGGLIHRLDYETQGLMLIARTMNGMESLLEQQKGMAIAKEYCALCGSAGGNLAAMEPPPGSAGEGLPSRIESAFRPYGPGRKAVRPVTGGARRKGAGLEQYVTGILESHELEPPFGLFRVRIYKGFRHQIRCHLAWAGKPIINDTLYGGPSSGKGFLALRACALSFADPSTGAETVFSIPPPGLEEI